jgi:hypothetical protein
MEMVHVDFQIQLYAIRCKKGSKSLYGSNFVILRTVGRAKKSRYHHHIITTVLTDVLQHTITQDMFLALTDEWLDLQKPLIPLLRLIMLKSFIDMRATAIFSDQLIMRLVEVSQSTCANMTIDINGVYVVLGIWVRICSCFA